MANGNRQNQSQSKAEEIKGHLLQAGCPQDKARDIADQMVGVGFDPAKVLAFLQKIGTLVAQYGPVVWQIISSLITVLPTPSPTPTPGPAPAQT